MPYFKNETRHLAGYSTAIVLSHIKYGRSIPFLLAPVTGTNRHNIIGLGQPLYSVDTAYESTCHLSRQCYCFSTRLPSTYEGWPDCHIAWCCYLQCRSMISARVRGVNQGGSCRDSNLLFQASVILILLAPYRYVPFLDYNKWDSILENHALIVFINFRSISDIHPTRLS